MKGGASHGVLSEEELGIDVGMTLKFVSIDLPQMPPQQLEDSILQTLRDYGEPLRWAITGVDVAQHRVQIEAVVIVEADWMGRIGSQRVRMV